MLYLRDKEPTFFAVAGVPKLLQQSVSKGAQGTAEPHDQEWHIDFEELIVVAAGLIVIVFGVFQVLPWRHLALVYLCDVPVRHGLTWPSDMTRASVTIVEACSTQQQCSA